MSNERLGIYDELRAKSRQFEARNNERKRMLQMGPAWKPVGLVARPAPPPRVKPKRGGYYYRNPNHSHRRRAVHDEGKLDVGVAAVVQAVCIESGLTRGELLGKKDRNRLASPRHACMWMLNRYCPEYSLPELAGIFDRDHTSIIHGIKRTDFRLQYHGPTQELIANVKRRLAELAAS